MNISRFFAAVSLLLLIPAAAVAAELSPGKQDTIYIAPVKVQPSIIELAEQGGRATELRRIADSLESQFVSALSATRVFQLVERKHQEKLEVEDDVAAGADALDEKAVVRTGKQAGAKFVLLVQIDGFEYNVEQVHYKTVGRSLTSRKLFLSALVQIVDTTTGRFLPDAPAMQLTKSEEVEKKKTVGSDRIIVAMAKEMAMKLSQEAVSFLRPAKVVMVSGKQVLINRGSESGFEKGDLITIYVPQKVKDEDSGENFINEIPVGQAIITRLDKKQSFADISGEDLGITKGTIARKLKSAAARRAEAENQPPDPTMPDLDPIAPAETTPGSSEKPFKWK
jgi:curli biogenesis system outer membrane secretion channel CsgG